MGKNKKLEKQNKDVEPKIEKDDNFIKKSKDAQIKQQVKKIAKAVKESLVKNPDQAESTEKEEIVIKKEKSPAKIAKLQQQKLNRKLKKAEKKAAAAQTQDGVKEAKKQGEDIIKKKTKEEPKNGSIKAEESAEASSPTSPVKKEITKTYGGPDETVFVGNLPTNIKRNQIAKLFAPYGTLRGVRFRTANGKIIFKHKMRKDTGAINAYVVLDSAEAATKALDLNGTKFKDQLLRVQKTESKEGAYNPQVTVFVGNLKFSATDEKLHQIFSNCGDIEYVRTIQSPDKKGCIGVAYVCFKNADSVGLALELKGTMLDDRPIHVERYSTNKLGAKERRDAKAEILQTKKGKGNPKDKSKGKAGGYKGAQNKNTNGTGGDKKNFNKNEGDEKKKKSEFRGVKSEVINKKKPKKKLPSQMKRLASKIAPKE